MFVAPTSFTRAAGVAPMNSGDAVAWPSLETPGPTCVRAYDLERGPRARMRASSRRLQWSTYHTSRESFSSQEMAFRPLTWAHPVIPGEHVVLSRICSGEYRSRVVPKQRPRPYEAQLTAQHVPELWELIDARRAEEPPERRQTRGVRANLLGRRERPAARRSRASRIVRNLSTGERSPAEARRGAFAESRALWLLERRPDGERSGDHHGAKADEPRGGDGAIEGDLERESNPGLLQARARAGAPTTVAPGGTSLVTTAPAPTCACAPTVRY